MYTGPGNYEHYKGGKYSVYGIGIEEAKLTPVVIYEPIDELPSFMKGYGARFWTRPLDEFNELINLPPIEDDEADDHDSGAIRKIPKGHKPNMVHRFTRLED